MSKHNKNATATTGAGKATAAKLMCGWLVCAGGGTGIPSLFMWLAYANPLLEC